MFLNCNDELPVTIHRPVLALVTDISRDFYKISKQILVQYVGSRASVFGTGTRLWVERYVV
jgi:hypothetical protein